MKMKNDELRVKSDSMQCFGIAFFKKEAARSDENLHSSLTSKGGF